MLDSSIKESWSKRRKRFLRQIDEFPIFTAQEAGCGRLVGMKRKYPRGMVDETIIGGPFVRYAPDPGTIFMVVEKDGSKEFVRAICPLVIWDRWGSFTVGAFRRCGCDVTQNYWVEKIEEVIVTDSMTVYQVPLVAWMSNWQQGNGA
jgi:hypothetical protein